MVSHAIEVLGWTLLHFVWQGAVVGVLAATLLVAWRRRSANVRYLTAVAALGLMLLLPLVTIAWIEQAPSSGEVVPIFATVTTTTELVPPLDGSAEPTLMTIERVGIDMENPPPPGSRPLLPVSDTNRMLDDLSEQQAASKAESFLKPYIPWMVAAWLIGVGVLSLRLFGSWWSVLRLRRQATQPVGESWQALLVRLKDRLRVTRPVQLVESALVEVPAVIGWLRPIILLPATAMTGLTTEQLEALLAHELAHVRQHDYLVNLLQTIVETLLFYHPAVWWLSHRIRVEREHCCDDLAASVCGDRLSYAKALVAMEELRTPSLGLALSARGGSLLSRVTRLLGVADEPSRSIGWLAGLIAMLTLTIAGALGAGLLTPPDNPTEGLPNDEQQVVTKSTNKNEKTSGPTERRVQETRAERELFATVAEGQILDLEFEQSVKTVEGFDSRMLTVTTPSPTTARVKGVIVGLTIVTVTDADGTEFAVPMEVLPKSNSELSKPATTALRPKPRKNPLLRPLSIVQNKESVVLGVHQPRFLEFPERILRVAGFDPLVITVGAVSPHQLRVTGLAVGKTSFTVDTEGDNHTIEFEVQQHKLSRESIGKLFAEKDGDLPGNLRSNDAAESGDPRQVQQVEKVDPEKRVIALVNGVAIHEADVTSRYFSQLALEQKRVVPEQFRLMVDELIRRDLPTVIQTKLLVAEAMKLFDVKQRQEAEDYLRREFAERDVARMMKDMGVTSRDELQSVLRQRGTSLERVELERKERFYAQQFLAKKLEPAKTPEETEKLRNQLLLQLWQQAKVKSEYLPHRGEIRWVDRPNQRVWINLGEADGVKRGAVFRVVSAPPNNDPAQPIVIKGKIAVIRLIDAHTSEARILESDNDGPAKGNEVIPADFPDPKSNGMDLRLLFPFRKLDEDKGRFVGRVRLKIDGEKPLPDLEKVEVPAGKVLDESLVFSKDGGLANVFVTLWMPKFPIEPATEVELAKPFVLIADSGKFWPHAAIVRVGRPVVFENGSAEPINFVTQPLRNQSFNVLVKREDRFKAPAFEKSESIPFPVKSNIKPWMLAHLLPLDHSFAAVTDDDGRFEINGLPPGEHEFRVWHERAGWLEKSLKITIKPDEDAKSELDYAPDRFQLTEADVLAWGHHQIDAKWIPRAMVPRPVVQPPNEDKEKKTDSQEAPMNLPTDAQNKSPQTPRKVETEADRARRNVLRQKAESDINIRYAKKSAEVAKIEWEKMQESNRKVPGSIPEAEIGRAKLVFDMGVLQIAHAEAEQASARAQFEDESLDKPSPRVLELRLKAAQAALALAKARAQLAKAEREKMLEANRKVPGSIPEAELIRAQLAYERAVLQGEHANLDIATIQALQAGKKVDDPSPQTLEVRLRLAMNEAAVAQAEYEKVLEANRKVPGAVPATEVERTRLNVEKTKLVIEQVQHELAAAKLSAVRRAVEFLKAQQQANGEWFGTPGDGVSALCAAALLQAGVKADDPVMQKALAHLRTIKPTLSYTVALQTMVFCSASPKEDAELIRKNVAWLEKAQATEGPNRGGWSYMENNTKIADGSCSRFAMLGLHAAKKAGFEIKAETWRNASDYWMSSQKKDNHAWGYQPAAGPTPSMTLSGMACLAIINQHLPQDEQTKLRTEAIERAVPYVEPNAHLLWQSGHSGYALQCLERAAHLNRWQKFGKHELRKLIDEKLLGLQKPEGHWTGVGGDGGGFFGAPAEQTPEQKAAAEAARRLQVQSNDLIATSFALMCLTGQPEPKLVGYRLRFEPRDAGKKFQMQSNLVENSSPPIQRTVISGGVRIELLKSDGLKCRIEADRAIIESDARVYEQLELNPESDVMRIECIGSVKCEDRRGAESTQLTAERLWFDVRRNLIQADKGGNSP